MSCSYCTPTVGTVMASSKLSPKDVVNALETLTDEETKRLFYHLDVPLHTLDNMKANHSGETFTIYCVHEWFKSNVDASWGMIVAGLKRIDRNVLAKEVATQHHVETPPSVGDSLTSDPINPPVSAQHSDGTQSSVTSGSDPVQPLTSEVSSDHPVKVSSESTPSNPVTSEVSSPHPATGSTDPVQQDRKK